MSDTEILSTSLSNSSPVIDKQNKENKKTFKDLLDYNLEFLSGKRNKVCYHQDVIDTETEPYLNHLISLHNLDILTTCSQPGYSINDDGYSQKAYIEFYCDPSRLEMIKKLERIKGYLFYVSDSQGNKIYSSKSLYFPYIITKLYNKGTCYLPPMTSKKRRKGYFWDNFESWTADCLSEHYMVQMVYPSYTNINIFEDLLVASNNFYQFEIIKKELKDSVQIFSFCGLMGVGKDYIINNYLLPNIKDKYLKISIAGNLKIRSVIENFADPFYLFEQKNFNTRKILQDFGQDKKNENGENYWINICVLEIYYQYKVNNIKTFIISDCRFPSESNVLKSLGSKIIKIIAPERNEKKLTQESKTCKNYSNPVSPFKRLKLHSSETSLDEIESDYILYNDPKDTIDSDFFMRLLNT